MEQKNETKGKIMIKYNHGILRLVSEETGVPLKMIQGHCRKKGIVMARDLYVNILYRCLQKSEDEISRSLAISREAVHRAKTRHKKRITTNKLYNTFYESIMETAGYAS